MDPVEVTPLERIDKSLADLDRIRLKSSGLSFSKWQTETAVIISGIFGGESGELRVFQKTAMGLTDHSGEPGSPDEALYYKKLSNLRAVLAGIRNVVREKNDSGEEPPESAAQARDQSEDLRILGNQVLLLLDAKKTAEAAPVLQFLKDRGIRPVLFREDANYAQVPLESVTDYHRFGHVFIFFPESPDDLVEMGFFTGRLGVKKITLILHEGDAFPFSQTRLKSFALDKAGAWRMRLDEVLQNAGFKVEG